MTEPEGLVSEIETLNTTIETTNTALDDGVENEELHREGDLEDSWKSDEMQNRKCPIRARKDLSSFNVLEDMESVELPKIPSSITFSSGNPVVEDIKGIIRLYNECESDPIMRRLVLPRKRSKILCVIGIPNWLSIGDLMNFFGFRNLNKIEAIRILRYASSSHYMVVLKAIDQQLADQIYKGYNGKIYSSMSESDVPERCILAFVKKVDFLNIPEKDVADGTAVARLFPDFSSYKEIPTCPVCLEHLDASVTGLLTILCNHTLHSGCLSGYMQEIRCPVCRYIAKPCTSPNVCSQCGAQSNLWICLLCGHIGCSRYQESHAKLHYLTSHHNYALELITQRVWDYAGDGYVHRIIQNKVDGKLVELPPPDAKSDYRSKECEPDKDELEKTEVISLEYQYLITAQLETQRTFYEQKMREIDSFRVKQLRKLELEQAAWKDREKKYKSDIKRLTAQLNEFNAETQRLSEQVNDLILHIEGQKLIAKDEDKFTNGRVLLFSQKTPRKKKFH